MSVTYRSNDQKAGAIPVDTVVKTTSTTDGQVQHVNVDTATLVSTVTTVNTVDALTDVTPKEFYLEVARGNVTGFSFVNKFGEAPNGVQTTDTDLWDRADSTPTQSIWLAPTAARVHAIASSSTDDVTGGVGAASVIVYGLPTWSTAEVNETVTLNGTTPVNTANSYVIIHRMKCVAQATTTNTGVNVGTITATAATDSTVTAAILPGNGQTEMAIYGVPSTKTAYMLRWSVNIDRSAAAAATVDFRLKVNENPNVQTVAFLRKDDISVQSNGTNAVERVYQVPYRLPGPCIIKIQGQASINDVDAESGFDMVLVNN